MSTAAKRTTVIAKGNKCINIPTILPAHWRAGQLMPVIQQQFDTSKRKLLTGDWTHNAMPTIPQETPRERATAGGRRGTSAARRLALTQLAKKKKKEEGEEKVSIQ